MAAARTSSFKALRALSQQQGQVRSLHMTGIHAAPSPIEAAHKTTYMPMGLQDLRSECRKRTLTASGTKHELVDRLAAHDSLQHRAFSIARRRITKSTAASTSTSGPFESSTSNSSTQSRQFNTTRSLKTVNDNSTVDLAFLPTLFSAEREPSLAAIRVPILPHVTSDQAEATLDQHPQLDAAAGGYQASDAGVSAIMIPQISTMQDNDGSVLSRLSDVGDGHTHEIALETLANLSTTIHESATKLVDMVKEKEQSTVSKVWSGFLDDVFGSKVAVKA